MRFRTTSSEAAVALGEETSFGLGNTTLTEFFPASKFEFEHNVNSRTRPESGLGLKLPFYSSRDAPKFHWSLSTNLWAEGLEALFKYGMGRHQQDETLAYTSGNAFAHLFLASSGPIPMYGPNPDNLADGLAIGAYLGDLTPAKGRFVKLRGCMISKTTISINCAGNSAMLNAEGFYQDACFDSTPPAVAWDAGYLFHPNATNLSFADASTSGAGWGAANKHWDPYSITLTMDNKLDQEVGGGHVLGGPFFRTPEAPHRSDAIDWRVAFDVKAGDFDSTMTSGAAVAGGTTWRQMLENEKHFHGYFEMFGEQILNLTDGSGYPKERSFRFQWDFATLVSWKTNLVGPGVFKHSCEAVLHEPPGTWYGDLANLYLTNGRGFSFGVR